MDTTHHWAYDMLKHLACETCSAQDLEDLKQTFAAEISTVRKAESVQSIHDLIEVLERHDTLSEYNIEPLREIAEQCGGNAIQHAVSAYHTPKETTALEPVNSFQEERLAEEMRKKLHIKTIQRTMIPPTAPPASGISLSPHPGGLYLGGSTIRYPGIHEQRAIPLRDTLVIPADNLLYQQQQLNPTTGQQQRAIHLGPCELTQDKLSDIYKNLSSKLGTDWRSFGRELRITEGEMDQIELQFPRDIRSRIYRVLNIFEEDGRNRPQEFIFKLSRALDNCRRKDLRRDIEDILSH